VTKNNLPNAARDELGKMDVSLETLKGAFGTDLFNVIANGPDTSPPNLNPIILSQKEQMETENVFNSNFEYFGQGFTQLRVSDILLIT